MSPEEIKATVGKVLGIPPEYDDLWSVLSTYTTRKNKITLALAHTKESHDQDSTIDFDDATIDKLFRPMRGIIVDVTNEVIVHRPPGHERTIELSDIIALRTEDDVPTHYTLMNVPVRSFNSDGRAVYTYGHEYFDMNKTIFRLGQQGLYTAFIVWDGERLLVTHKKIGAEKSSWDGKTTYGQILVDLGLGHLLDPEDEILKSYPFSPYTVGLYLIHPAQQLVTMSSTYRALKLGPLSMWGPETLQNNLRDYIDEYAILPTGEYDLSLPHDWITLGVDTDYPEPDIFSTEFRPPRVEMPITPAIANQWLFPERYAASLDSEESSKQPDNGLFIEYGEFTPNYPPDFSYPRERFLQIKRIRHNRAGEQADERLAGGEYVLMETLKDDGTVELIKLVSPAMAFRSEIIGGNPNLFQSFVYGFSRFTRGSGQNESEIDFGKYPTMNDIDGKPVDIAKADKRQDLWFHLFNVSVAIHYRSEVQTYKKRLIDSVIDLAKFILYDFKDPLQDNEISVRLYDKDPKKADKTRRRLNELKRIDFRGKRNANRVTLLTNFILEHEYEATLYKFLSKIARIRAYQKKAN